MSLSFTVILVNSSMIKVILIILLIRKIFISLYLYRMIQES